MAEQPKMKSDRQTKAAQPKAPPAAQLKPGPVVQSGMPNFLDLQRIMADPAAASRAGILSLQKMAGNRSVQRLLLQRAGPLEEEEIQTKPLIQRAGPEEEEEVQTKPLIQRASPEEEEEVQTKPLIQRAGPEEEEEIQTKTLVQRSGPLEEEEVQTKPLIQRAGPEEEEEIQTKPAIQRIGPQGGQVPPAVEAAIQRARHGGQPLDSSFQQQMRGALGYDFSGVRVHADQQAGELNQQVSARAFTTGHDIFFGQGEYNPGSSGGREVIAHELMHVVQQSSGRVSTGGSGMHVRAAGDQFEQEADSLAQQTQSAPVQTGQKNVVQRWNPEGHRTITAKAFLNQALKRRFDDRTIEILKDRSPDMDFIQDQQDKMNQGIAESDENITLYKNGVKQLLTQENASVRNQLNTMWVNNDLHRRKEDYMRMHGEGGLYRKNQSESAAINYSVTQALVNKAVGLYNTGLPAEGIEVLSDGLHQAEDRGAHGEGERGRGHDARQKVTMSERLPQHRLAFQGVPLINDVYPYPDNSDINKQGAQDALGFAQDALLLFASKTRGKISATTTPERHAKIKGMVVTSRSTLSGLLAKVHPALKTGGFVNELAPGGEDRAGPVETPVTAEATSALGYYMEGLNQQREDDLFKLAQTQFAAWHKARVFGGLSKGDRIAHSQAYFRDKVNPLREKANGIATSILKAYQDEFKEALDARPKLGPGPQDPIVYKEAKQQFMIWHRRRIQTVLGQSGGLSVEQRILKCQQYYQERVLPWYEKAELIAKAIKNAYKKEFNEPDSILEG